MFTSTLELIGGAASLHLANNPDWVVFAFEPTPKLYLDLKEKTAHAPNYHVFPLAVSDKPGILEFNIAAGGDGGTSSLLNFAPNVAENWPSRTDFRVTETTYATVITLRDFVLQYGIERIDHLHTDVQGVDLQVLDGDRRKNQYRTSWRYRMC